MKQAPKAFLNLKSVKLQILIKFDVSFAKTYSKTDKLIFQLSFVLQFHCCISTTTR
jgi:hypothetical protein